MDWIERADVLERALQFVDESGVAIRESRQIHAINLAAQFI